MTYNEIKELLSTGTHKVVFTKVDGTLRTMNCTRDNTIIGAVVETRASEKEPVINESVMVAFDLDIDKFRSFKVDSVISITSD